MNALRDFSNTDYSKKLYEISKDQIKTYDDFSFLIYLVRGKLDREGTRDQKQINRFFELITFIFHTYQIKNEHYTYVLQKSGIDLNEDYLIQVYNKRNKLHFTLEEYCSAYLNYEYELRIVETIFRRMENLHFKKETIFNLFSKKERLQQEMKNFETLKDLVWPFVEVAKTFHKNAA